MRIMGLDFGSKTVGVAVSDPTGFIATGVEIIRREREDKLRKTYSRIEELITEYSVEKIVLGYPLNMDDSSGERVRKTLSFKEDIERRTGIPVVLMDERLSTVEAEELMNEMRISGADRKKVVDKIAATFILQWYLDEQRDGKN
ncbi:MAG: Holliday junction resolvase RuvX [Lachnospiraceae bacterium]|nr:Holliday junction resolvase RuvX [Lachnospiraceae bacterium]MBQ6637957.1 Holliday junction resolvase RuvX [Lachnospiraceae bacterium]MBR3638564.1 Holliday junction resolvase RuvX [Lachnospiraceae bacterium]